MYNEYIDYEIYDSNAVGSTLDEQPPAVLYNDVDGFLDAEENKLRNTSHGIYTLAATDSAATARSSTASIPTRSAPLESSRTTLPSTAGGEDTGCRS